MIWFLIVLGPVGVTGLEAFNFLLRYDYLTKVYEDDLWKGLIGEARHLAMPTLLMGITIITSMIANVEHQTTAWKQLLALPVSKMQVFTGKFVLAVILLFVSSTLLGAGIITLGITLKFGIDIPFIYLMKMSYYPYLAALPFIALQIWLSITVKNQAIPLTIGIVGTMLSLYSIKLPDWFPWKWPTLMNEWGGPVYSVAAGLALGVIVYTVGLSDFTRKDVK